MDPPPQFKGRLVHARPLTPNVRELVFERVDGRPMQFEPGQWVNAILPIAPEASQELPPPASAGSLELGIKRSYSIASPPDGSPRFEIAVTRVRGGPGSTWMHELGPGAMLEFVGPQGFFTRQPGGAPPSLMIATGTGVTPMRSMLRAAIESGSRTHMWLVLGVRHEEDMLYRDELEKMAHDHPFVRFEPTLSQPRGHWGRRRGYVQTHARPLWDELDALSETRPHAYVCGLQRMVGSVRSLLRQELGVPRDRVHTERYD